MDSGQRPAWNIRSPLDYYSSALSGYAFLAAFADSTALNKQNYATVTSASGAFMELFPAF